MQTEKQEAMWVKVHKLSLKDYWW